MEFFSTIQGVEKLIVRDVYSRYDNILEDNSEVFDAMSGEFGLPHILASDYVGGWSTKDLCEDEGTISVGISSTSSDEIVFLQIIGIPMEGNGELLDPVKSPFVDQDKKRKSRSNPSAPARESVQSKLSKSIDDMNVDYRCHYRMLIKDIGLPLHEAETPFVLLEALLHGMVGE